LISAAVDLHEGPIGSGVEPQKEMRPAQSFPTDMANLDGFVIGCSCDDRCQSVFEEEDMTAWLIAFHQHRSDREIDPFHAGLQQPAKAVTQRTQEPVLHICSLDFSHFSGSFRGGARTRTHQDDERGIPRLWRTMSNTLAWPMNCTILTIAHAASTGLPLPPAPVLTDADCFRERRLMPIFHLNIATRTTVIRR
jgi:hypothetical protein